MWGAPGLSQVFPATAPAASSHLVSADYMEGAVIVQVAQDFAPQRVSPRPSFNFAQAYSGPALSVPGVAASIEMSPLPRSSSHSLTESKVREWLAAIPRSVSEVERDWDDTQILKIVQFAQECGLEELPVEEIYRQYVMHQVNLADCG